MFIKRALLASLLFFITLNTQAIDYQSRPLDTGIEEGIVDSINHTESFLTVGDMSYHFDFKTIVYDSNGQLRSIRQIKPGQNLALYIRHTKSTSSNKQTLDKIIFH